MSLRAQLEGASGSFRPTNHGAMSAALAGVGVLVLAAALTFGLGVEPAARSTTAWAGAFLANAMLLGGLAVALRVGRPPVFASGPSFALLSGMILLVVIVASVVARLRPGAPELVPVAFIGVVTSALYDRRLSVAMAALVSALIAAQPAYRLEGALPVMLVAGGAAALSVRPTSRRDQSYIWMLIIAAATAVMLAATELAAGHSGRELLQAVLRGGATAVASVIVAMLLMPFAERVTGRETHLTLLEWGDLNRPLLQRLSLEAPGTYAHTIAIANLAEAACRAIGANALLARVGAYYHDIGKLAKPQYFVENQPRGRNLHDKLKPNTSASIIRNHIREGLELAEAEHVPRSIRAFITEHHGTGTIAFFLEKARERDGAVPNTAEYTYPGPVPQSIETAVVMLADGAEAAARSLAEPTPENIREVIDAVVRQRLEQGQLRDAPLTLRQLTVVKREFARVLGGMYHGRVDYPTPAPSVEAVPR
ncbi:MAG TPA: HDIG domain-containing protein [Gemmatimonadaceae bacterium]